MNNYKPKFVRPEDYERMRANEGKPFPLSDYVMDRWEWIRLFRDCKVRTMGEFVLYREKLAQQFRDSRSNWFQRLIGLAWYKLILPKSKEYLTPKKLVWVLTHLDRLLPWMPNEMCREILNFLDKAAMVVYLKME